MIDDNKPNLTMLSECRYCEKWIPDPDGNSYWTYNPLEKHVTYTICDQCKIEERMFRIAKDFVDGIEYKFPFHERRVDFCVQNLINKFGPKSHKKYICLSIYMTEDWMSDHMFKIEDNGPEWFAE